MKALILLAAALGCQAAPQVVVPLVYTSASTPAGVIPAFSSLLNVVQGPKPVILSTAPSVVSAPVPVPAVPALPLGLSATQYRSQDELGNVAFSHAGGPNSRSEVRTAFGAQVGSFSYIDGEGKVQHRSYVSDALGTRMAGTDLPVAPKETPEVTKARAALTEMQASRGGRSRRSTSTLPLLRYGTSPLGHFVKAGTVALPLTTYSSFPSVVHVAAPGACPNVVTPALAIPTDKTTKGILKTIDTLNPGAATAGGRPAPSPVLLKAARAQPVVAASASSSSVVLATEPGPSTVVVKSAPSHPVAEVNVGVHSTLAVASPPAPTPVLVTAADTPVAVAAQPKTPIVVGAVSAAALPAPHPVHLKSAPAHFAVPTSFSPPAVALATKPGPSTVVLKSTPAQPFGALGVGALPAPATMLVKAADTHSADVPVPFSPQVALATKPGPSTTVVKFAPSPAVASVPVAAPPAFSPALVKAAPAQLVVPGLAKSAPTQLVVPGPVFSPASALVGKPGPSSQSVQTVAAVDVAAQPAVALAAPPAPAPVLLKDVDTQAAAVSDVFSPPVALVTHPGPSTVVVKSAPAQPVPAVAAQPAVALAAPPAPAPVLLKAVGTQAAAVSDVFSPPVALATHPGPSTVVVKSAPAQSVPAVAAQPAVALAAPPAPAPVLLKAVGTQAVAVSDVSSPPVALATQPGPSTVVVKSAPAQPVPAVAAIAQPVAPSVLTKGAPVAAVAVSAPFPKPLEAPSPPAPSPEVPFRGGKFHSQDELGQYTFGHFGGSHTRVETKNFLGHTRGSFAYVNPEGEVHVRKYAAAPGLGFTVAGSDLPVDTNRPVKETLGVAKPRKNLLTLIRSENEAKARVESAGPAAISV